MPFSPPSSSSLAVVVFAGTAFLAVAAFFAGAAFLAALALVDGFLVATAFELRARPVVLLPLSAMARPPAPVIVKVP